tara:strand:+ start:193 stop:390 length:198 start_codon:yes stop_codon:yes gene_type:complete
MNRLIGNTDFHIAEINTGAGYILKMKVTPLGIYFERNREPDDNRIQFGISIFNYRIGISLENTGY